MGSVEGCFLNPIPGSTTPMLVRALGVIVRRSVLFGKCYTSLEPRLSFVGGKESLVHTVCACVNISVNFSVKLSGYY